MCGYNACLLGYKRAFSYILQGSLQGDVIFPIMWQLCSVTALDIL